MGELILLFLFVVMLAGRFNLARLDDDAAGLELRFAYVYVVALAVMIWLMGARQHLPKRVPLIAFAPFTMWCLWMALSAWHAPDEARTADGAWDFLFLFGLVALSWIVMSYLPTDSLDRVWTWLLVTGVAYFVLAIASGPGDQGRFSAPGGGPNTFVRIMIAASIAALYMSIMKRKTLVLWLVPVFAIGAALSGSRGGLASAAVVMVVFFVPVLRKLGIGKSLVMLFFAGVAGWAASFWRDGYLVKFVQERFIQQTLIEGYSSGRNEITWQIFDMFTSNPVIGVGLDGFYASQHGRDGYFEHPHNLVLATLGEAGIIGGLLLFAVLLRLVFTAVGKKIPTSAFFAVIVGIYFFGTSMFSGDYYDSRFIWFFLGFAAIRAVRGRRDSSPNPRDGIGTPWARRRSSTAA